MSKTVNVAMIGLGFGAEFIPIYQAHPQANVYAVCRRNEAELHKVGDRFGIEKRFARYDDVLADPAIDFVHINSPIPDHAWMSLRALDAGKHVMCTVPMATTIDECRQIVEKVNQTGLKYMMAETVVYSREFLFIKEQYEKGELGKIQHLAASHPQDMDGWPEYWERMIPDWRQLEFPRVASSKNRTETRNLPHWESNPVQNSLFLPSRRNNGWSGRSK